MAQHSQEEPLQRLRLNMNGTSFESLQAERMAALEALHRAREALQGLTVNGRDFQTFPEGGRRELLLAGQQHRLRLASIEAIEAEIEAEVLDLQRQAGK